MKFLRNTFILLAIFGAFYAWASNPDYDGTDPQSDGSKGNGFKLLVVDTDIDAAWEIMTSDTGFTAMSDDTTITVAYAWQSHLDTTLAGNTSDLMAIWSLSSSADATGTNPLIESGTVAYGEAVFSDGGSPETDAYWFIHNAGNTLKQGTGPFSYSIWAKSTSATNPSVVEVVFSSFATPDEVRLEFTTDGYIRATLTDDSEVSKDQVTGTVDVYDGEWHHHEVQRTGDRMSVFTDGSSVGVAAVSSAGGAIDPDSANVGAFRGAENFIGKVDEAWITDAAHDPEFLQYIYRRGQQGLDTALVKIRGLAKSDTTYRTRVCSTITAVTPCVTDSTWIAFESAFLDTAENQPIVLFTTGTQPQDVLLDSIPTGRVNYPIGHVLFGDRGWGSTIPTIDKVIFTNYGAAAVTYELRIYHGIQLPLVYGEDYEVRCAGYIASGGNPIVCDYGPNGLSLEAESYVAGFAKGASANASGTMLIIGTRSTR